MKLTTEKIVLPESCSWGFYHRVLEGYPFHWHCHPEYELTLTLNASGYRYVGDDIEPFDREDLVLLGSNLPHSWSADTRVPSTRPLETFVLWFSSDWVQQLTGAFVEFEALGALFRKAERGLLFSSVATAEARVLIEQLPDLSPRARFARMLQVLDLLAGDEPRSLASASYAGRVTPPVGQKKLASILHYIHDNYMGSLSVEEVANRFGMSQSTFFRFFKRHTAQTFSDYVASLRIGKACALLVEGDAPIYSIAEQVGYRNLSNFYRQFRAYKRLSPAAFRHRFEPDPAPTAEMDAACRAPEATTHYADGVMAHHA